MTITAKLKYLRIAPRKVRLVADLIRGKGVSEALIKLKFLSKKTAQPMTKFLKSAIADAKHNFQKDDKNLYISKLLVDEGPKLKRWRARARGVAFEIQKKTSHITIVLDEIGKKSKKVKKIKKVKPKIIKLNTVRDSDSGKRTQKQGISNGIKETEIKKKRFKFEKRKFRPEKMELKQKTETGIKRIFRRKAF